MIIKYKETRHSLCSRKDVPANSGRKPYPEEPFPLVGKASLSVEAASAVPLFLLFCVVILSFLQILCLQVNLQARMGETARNIGKKVYLLDHMSEEAGNLQETVGEGLDSETVSWMSAGINSLTIKTILLSDSTFRNNLEQSGIKGGISGLYTYASSFHETNGILDIAVCYDYSVPWMPGSFGTLRFVQRMRSHVWTGKSLEENRENNNGNSDEIVYVTPTGSVYHLSSSCSYLDLSIHTASFDSLSSLRNANGAKYTCCEECAAAGHGDTVYITDYGTRWHSSLSCSGLKRTVIEMNISEVEGMRICTKCQNGEHGPHSH